MQVVGRRSGEMELLAVARRLAEVTGPCVQLLARLGGDEYAPPVRRERLIGAELDRYLAAVTEALVRVFSPERVILFGSFARGDQNRASDVDIVVIASTALPFCDRIGRAIGACDDASTTTRLPVEPLVYTPEEWTRMQAAGSSFVEIVRREGRALYDQESKPDRGAAVAQAGAS